MSSKTSGYAVQQFLDKVKSSNIIQKQDEVREIIWGPLAVAREKISLLDTDEAFATLSRVDFKYRDDLKENVERIFAEEVERGTHIIEEIDSALNELQALLETLLQRICTEVQTCQPSSLGINQSCYEDARSVLIFLKLKTNELRLRLAVPVHEQIEKADKSLDSEIENGEFSLFLSRLEASCL